MTTKESTASLKTIGVVAWTCLPCLAIWIGMYVLKNAFWAYALYHGLCLLPAIVWGKSLWRRSLAWPTGKEMALLIIVSVLFNAATIVLYELIGNKLLSNEQVLALLKQQGCIKEMFWVFGIYSIFVNPLIEELFWRGVIFQ